MTNFRRFCCYLLPLCVMPLVVWAAANTDARYTALLIVIMAALTLLLFFCGIGQEKIGTRRLVLSAVFMALAVVGRMIPLLKPVTAMVILAALYLGKEAGFLVGAGAAVISNFLFGQGPWTVFQMLAWGLIGFFAGILSQPLLRSKALLLCYGAVTGIAYSMLMDVWTVLWHYEGFSMGYYTAALLTALPYTLLYVGGNLLFLWLLAKPVGHKLQRIRIKYGL